MPTETHPETAPSLTTLGERRSIKLSASPLRRAVPAVIAAATDTNGARAADDGEAAASDAAFAPLRLLADTIAGDVIFGLDRALRFSFASRAAEAFFARPFDGLRGRPLAALSPDADAGDSPFVARLRDAFRSGTAQTFEITFPGTETRYTASVTPHADGVFVCLRAQEVLAQTRDAGSKTLSRSDRMIELAPESIYLYDVSLGTYSYINPAGAQALGYTLSEMAVLSPLERASRVVGEDVAAQQEARARVRSGAIVGYEARQRHRDGSLRTLCSRETVFERAEDGTPLLLLGVARDVTAQRSETEAVRCGAEQARRFAESSPDWVLTLDLSGGLIHINPAGKALMEIGDFAPLVGAEWPLLFVAEHRDAARDALSRALAGTSARFQGVAKTAMGTPLWWDVVVAPDPPAHGKPGQILTVARDISGFKALESERERLLQETITRADFDPLTGLFNHRAFHRRLEEAATGERNAVQPFAILLTDLENFRYFNEAYGRAVGDELLVRIAKELSACCRSVDTLARVGPDEFGIIAPRLAPREIGPYVLRLRAAIDGIGMRSPDGADAIPLHISVGYALFPEDTASVTGAYDIAEERQRADRMGGHSREAERVRISLQESVESFGMLDTLIATIDSKDRLTRRQSEDTLIYCRRIAGAFGLSDGQKRSLEIAALLHDIGKVGIDERILRQPGKLSDKDFGVIQQHPKIGAMLVGSIIDDVDAVEAILYHHENWNGTGYPAGLSGEDIPLLARVLNVSSSYAAMTNNRPYRKGMTQSAAQKVLQGGAGSQWDAGCVSALIAAANG